LRGRGKRKTGTRESRPHPLKKKMFTCGEGSCRRRAKADRATAAIPGLPEEGIKERDRTKGGGQELAVIRAKENPENSFESQQQKIGKNERGPGAGLR